MSTRGPYERRRVPRVSAKLDVAYEDRERQVFLSVADLSEQGVLVEDDDPPLEGSVAQMVLALPDSRLLRLRGQVTRVQEEPKAFAFRFDRDEMDASDRQALRNFIEGAATHDDD